MKRMTLLLLSMTVLLTNVQCTSQSESVPTVDGSPKLTLKPGESQQVKIDGVTYKIVYTNLKVNFSEGVVEGSTNHIYRLGEVKLVVNEDSVSLRAEGHYDDKGGRQANTWTYLKDSQATANTGAIIIGVANFYPVASDLSTGDGYVIDLLIQSK